MVCAANLGSNKLVQRLLTPTVDNSKRLFRPICTPLLQFYIDRMDKEKTFSETLSEARKVSIRFAKNWEKFAKVWDWPGDHMLREKASWPLLVKLIFKPLTHTLKHYNVNVALAHNG